MDYLELLLSKNANFPVSAKNVKVKKQLLDAISAQDWNKLLMIVDNSHIDEIVDLAKKSYSFEGSCSLLEHLSFFLTDIDENREAYVSFGKFVSSVFDKDNADKQATVKVSDDVENIVPFSEILVKASAEDDEISSKNDISEFIQENSGINNSFYLFVFALVKYLITDIKYIQEFFKCTDRWGYSKMMAIIDIPKIRKFIPLTGLLTESTVDDLVQLSHVHKIIKDGKEALISYLEDNQEYVVANLKRVIQHDENEFFNPTRDRMKFLLGLDYSKKLAWLK